MPAIVVTEDVTQPEMSLLNCELSANMPNIDVTADVSHVPMSSLNVAAFRFTSQPPPAPCLHCG